MEKISIKNTAVNIFKPATQKQETKHTNPFGLSFKGNVLSADVFSSTKIKTQNNEPSGLLGSITEKGRAVKSAIVGGINNFNNELTTRFNNGINRIVSFGKKIGENTKAIWKKANETNIVWDFSGLSKSFKGFANMDVADLINNRRESYKVKDLVKRPVGELETMLKEELEGIKG